MSDTVRLFISVPMTGRNEEEVLEQIEKEKSKAITYFNERGENVIVCASYITEDDIESKGYANHDIYLLAKSIEILSCANAIWMGEGWKKSRGCQVEHKIATEYYLGRYYSELVGKELC